MVTTWEGPSLTTTNSALVQSWGRCAPGRGGKSDTRAEEATKTRVQVRRMKSNKQRESAQLHSQTEASQLIGISENLDQKEERKMQG